VWVSELEAPEPDRRFSSIADSERERGQRESERARACASEQASTRAKVFVRNTLATHQQHISNTSARKGEGRERAREREMKEERGRLRESE
jgi:hypothetical protein